MNRVVRVAWLGVVAIATISCTGDEKWIDMKVGQKWTYTVRTPHYKYVEDVKVTGRAPVGSVSGFVFESQLGQTHLAWYDDALWTTRVGHTIFVTPAPLFDASKEKRTWSGTISVAGKTSKGQGELQTENEEIRLGGMKVKARKSVLHIQLNGSQIECTTWLARGFGIVKQEQRTDGVLDVSLERVRGT